MGEFTRSYRDKVVQTLDAVVEDRNGAFRAASQAVAAALAEDHLVYVAGSGHSHLIAAEAFYRAGGIAAAQAMFDPDLMLHVGAASSTLAERESGRAEALLDRYGVNAGDVVFIVSNSGRNAFPVEMASGTKARSAVAIALTSVRHSAQVTSRHASGKRLFEIADIVLDNGADHGDACVAVGRKGVTMGPTSTIIGAFVINAVLAEAVHMLAEQGVDVDVYPSSNAQETDGAVEDLVSRWKPRIAGL